MSLVSRGVGDQQVLVAHDVPWRKHGIIKRIAIVVGDISQQLARPKLSRQQKPYRFDFDTCCAGALAACLPLWRQLFLDSGALIEKKVVAQTLFEPVWIGWNEQTAGLASGWWRDEILANSAIAGVYAKSDDGKSAI